MLRVTSNSEDCSVHR